MFRTVLVSALCTSGFVAATPVPTAAAATTVAAAAPLAVLMSVSSLVSTGRSRPFLWGVSQGLSPRRLRCSASSLEIGPARDFGTKQRPNHAVLTGSAGDELQIELDECAVVATRTGTPRDRSPEQWSSERERVVFAVFARRVDREPANVFDEPIVDDPAEPALIELSELAARDDRATPAPHELGNEGRGHFAPDRLDVRKAGRMDAFLIPRTHVREMDVAEHDPGEPLALELREEVLE